jgi:adenylylsulfate kinase
MKESHSRSVIKGVSWRIIASVTTMSLVYIFTGDFFLVASVGVIEFIAKVTLYYFHERAWGRVNWGLVRIKN